MWIWLVFFIITAVWGIASFVIPQMRNSILNVIALSVFANIFAVAGGVQTTLTMRKADPKDEF
jgi:hypothetical protein